MSFDHIPPADSQDERIARLRLARTQRVGPVHFGQLIRRFGSAARALAELPHIVRRNGGSLTPCPLDRLDAELARAEATGARLLVLGDAAYPALLKQTDAAPPVLWTLGSLAPQRRAVAVVGARNASAAGQKMAQILARALGEAGFQIVSGLARGVDTRAHETSLGTGTVAVLGGGVDDIYPPENRALYERIRADGLLVSESPAGHRATAQDFPRRNRIISGLSLATVVVEAELRSGSLITARLAAEQNREVFAVPGSPLDPRCRGTNDLLRQGANLCESAEDVIRVLDSQMGWTGNSMASPESLPLFAAAAPGSPPVMPQTAGDEDAIARASRVLLNLVGSTPVHRDDLLSLMAQRMTGLPAWAGRAALGELEIAGQVVAAEGGFYTRF